VKGIRVGVEITFKNMIEIILGVLVVLIVLWAKKRFADYW
jgi:hypothetical protein